MPVITNSGGETNGRIFCTESPNLKISMLQSEFKKSCRVAAAVVLACAVTGASGCGEAPPTLEAFCDEAAQGICKLLFNRVCLDTELSGLTPRYPDEAACAEQEAALCKEDGAAQDLYDATEATACLTSIETATCRNAARGAFPGCEKVWDGLAPPIRPINEGDTDDSSDTDDADNAETGEADTEIDGGSESADGTTTEADAAAAGDTVNSQESDE